MPAVAGWFLLLLALAAGAAPLPLPDGGLLTHPRPEGDAVLPVLATARDVFVNGKLGQATTITCEGKLLRATTDGRFADRVPWPADRRLDFQLANSRETWDWVLELGAPAWEVDQPAPSAPRAPGSAAEGGTSPWMAPVRVRLDGTPLSTVPDGAYWIFPQPGAEVVADRRQDGWLRIPLSGQLAAWLPERRATRLGSASQGEPPRRLGPAVRSTLLDNGDLELVLPIDGDSPPLWREEAAASGGEWRLVLSHTQGVLDWAELDPLGRLLRLDWEPLPGEELLLRADLLPGTFQGHTIRWSAGELRLVFHRRSGLSGARILLDPGHGGRESGCIGASGTAEKELALTAARELRQELEKAGAQVRLTREGDSTLSLADRVAQAKAWRADFLLSLHYNSVGPGEDPWKADGFMVFSWSPWSAPAAARLHASLRRRLPQRDRGLHWRSLGVCRHSGCPALLVELGSLAHPGEEARMLDAASRRRQLKAIRKGLEDWFGAAAAVEPVRQLRIEP